MNFTIQVMPVDADLILAKQALDINILIAVIGTVIRTVTAC